MWFLFFPFFFWIVIFVDFFLKYFFGVFDCTVDTIGFEKVLLKLKKIIFKFYILFNNTQNVINNFY